MSTLTADEERYAIEQIEFAIENPEEFSLDAESVERLKAALQRHKDHLHELEEAASRERDAAAFEKLVQSGKVRRH